MPAAVGYDVKVGRGKKWIDERQRVEDLFAWARTVRDTSRHSTWRRSERQYVGKHWTTSDGADPTVDRHQITVNMSFSTVNTIVPYITGNEPSFFVEPYLAPADKRGAVYLKAWLNRLWRNHEVNGQEHLEFSAVHSMIYGDGYMQVFWEYVTGESGGDAFSSPDVNKYAKIWVDTISPWDVWLDPYADGLHNARFVAVRNEQPLSVIQESKLYSNTATLGLSDERTILDEDGNRSEGERFATSDERDAVVELIEFYDLVDKRLIVFVVGHEFPLRVVEGVRCPVFQLKNYHMPKSPYGMSELEQLWSLQQELNETRSQMVSHRERNVAKWMVRKNLLSADAITALKSAEINAVIEVETNQSFGEIVAPLEMAQLGADPYQVSDLVTRDIYEISGVNEYLRGASPQITRTATEASIIESASNVKSGYKLRQVEKFVRKIGQYILDVAMDVFPQTEISEFEWVVTGSSAQEIAAAEGMEDPSGVTEGTMSIGDDIFEGEYEVFVESNSTEMRNPRFREEKYKEMFMTLLQAAPIMVELGFGPPNMTKLLELWLEASGVENIDAIMQSAPQQAPPPQDPMAAMMGGQQPPPGGPQGPPPGPEGQMPPDMAAVMAMMGGGAAPGMPMPGNAQAPVDPLDAQNTGAIPPQ